MKVQGNTSQDCIGERETLCPTEIQLLPTSPCWWPTHLVFTYFQDHLLGMITLKYQNSSYTFHLKIYNSAQQLKSLLIPSCSLWDLWHPADQKWFIPIEFQKRKKYFPKCQVSTSYKFRQFTGGSDHMMVEQAVIQHNMSWTGCTALQCMWLKVDQTGWLERGFLGPQFEEWDGVIWAQPARGPHPPTSCPTNPPALFFCIFIIKTCLLNNDHCILEFCQLVHLLVSYLTRLSIQIKFCTAQCNAIQSK